jgi:hypothetical protein
MGPSVEIWWLDPGAKTVENPNESTCGREPVDPRLDVRRK